MCEIHGSYTYIAGHKTRPRALTAFWKRSFPQRQWIGSCGARRLDAQTGSRFSTRRQPQPRAPSKRRRPASRNCVSNQEPARFQSEAHDAPSVPPSCRDSRPPVSPFPRGWNSAFLPSLRRRGQSYTVLGRPRRAGAQYARPRGRRGLRPLRACMTVSTRPRRWRGCPISRCVGSLKRTNCVRTHDGCPGGGGGGDGRLTRRDSVPLERNCFGRPPVAPSRASVCPAHLDVLFRSAVRRKPAGHACSSAHCGCRSFRRAQG